MEGQEVMNKVSPYTRKVNYYETDRMGIVHHSNYIRYFEEARLDFMEKAGFDYFLLEQDGIISPVLETTCRHSAMLHYGEAFIIETTLTFVGNVKYSFSYIMTNAKTGEKIASGTSTHCFLNEEYKIISLKRVKPEIFEKLSAFASEN